LEVTVKANVISTMSSRKSRTPID